MNSKSNVSRQLRGRPLPAALAGRLREMVDELGEEETLRRVGASRNALYRGLAGLSVLPGTEALFRDGVASRRLDSNPPPSAA